MKVQSIEKFLFENLTRPGIDWAFERQHIEGVSMDFLYKSNTSVGGSNYRAEASHHIHLNDLAAGLGGLLSGDYNLTVVSYGKEKPPKVNSKDPAAKIVSNPKGLLMSTYSKLAHDVYKHIESEKRREKSYIDSLGELHTKLLEKFKKM